jgi:uncharacterized protein YecT (DUF1311 family)
MDQLWTAIITTVCTVAASLLVTYIFNKVSGLPKKINDEKKAREDRISCLEEADKKLDAKFNTKFNELENKIDEQAIELSNKITTKQNAMLSRLEVVEEAVSHYPEYRAQSLQIQKELQCKDESILAVCEKIEKIGQKLDDRLIELERREKNSLRAKILNEYRLYTDERKNPRQAWTEMEHHSFFKLVEDYESLGGNDYVHSVVLPAMNELDVISMDQLTKIKDLYDSRNVK